MRDIRLRGMLAPRAAAMQESRAECSGGTGMLRVAIARFANECPDTNWVERRAQGEEVFGNCPASRAAVSAYFGFRWSFMSGDFEIPAAPAREFRRAADAVEDASAHDARDAYAARAVSRSRLEVRRTFGNSGHLMIHDSRGGNFEGAMTMPRLVCADAFVIRVRGLESLRSLAVASAWMRSIFRIFATFSIAMHYALRRIQGVRLRFRKNDRSDMGFSLEPISDGAEIACRVSASLASNRHLGHSAGTDRIAA